MLPEEARRAERVSVGAGFPGPHFSANSQAGGDRGVKSGQFKNAFDDQRKKFFFEQFTSKRMKRADE